MNLDCINALVDVFLLCLCCGLVYATLCRYLVGVSAAVAAHSLLQLLISLSRLQRKVFVVPSPSYAWLLYAGDQVNHTVQSSRFVFVHTFHIQSKPTITLVLK